MNNNEFYQIDIPISVRESFNNTILLLTMVKSEYYYIIGFSRINGIIEIGFDYESDLHSTITENIVLDFYTKEGYVVLYSKLKNIEISDFELMCLDDSRFSVENNSLIYRTVIQSDKLIPTSVNKMNKYILQAKADILDFLECYYKRCITRYWCIMKILRTIYSQIINFCPLVPPEVGGIIGSRENVIDSVVFDVKHKEYDKAVY